MIISRRHMCAFLPGILATLPIHASESETGKPLLSSGVFEFSRLEVEGESNDHFILVLEGSIHTGFNIRLHETELAPGATAHAPHRHLGEELFMVREGTLQVEIAGAISSVGVGSVAYVASNVRHATRNVSGEWTRYFVVLFGSAKP
jgi:quercetin dioxygenase-like cupin family protein